MLPSAWPLECRGLASQILNSDGQRYPGIVVRVEDDLVYAALKALVEAFMLRTPS